MTETAELTERERLIYAAGLIDGEGCIGAYNIRQATETKAPYAQITVRVGMVTPYAVKMLHEMFGGRLWAAEKKRARVRQVFVWTVRNRHAETCLRQLLPFLREKREQAETALLLAELRRTRSGHLARTPLTDAEIAERQVYVARLKEIKRQEFAATALQ